MIISNPDIVGIVIGENEFKLVQFADDTTLMLDGTLHSLQSAFKNEQRQNKVNLDWSQKACTMG